VKSEQTNLAAPDDAGFVFGKDISAAKFKDALVLLFLLGLIVRIGYFVEHAHSPFFGVPVLDEKYYDTVAKMLLAGDDLHELHGFRPLLYPMFLAVLYKLGGSAGITLALFVQHLLGVATGLIVVLLAARLFRHRLCGVAAGILFLLAPVPLFFEGELLIESSYIFLICLNLLLLLRAANSNGWRSALLWLLCGALTILTSQARANVLVFLAVYPLFAAWRWWRVQTTAALLPLLGLAGALAMMIPWGIINMRQSDHFHLMPNAGGVNLFLGNERGANGMFTGENVIARLSDLNLPAPYKTLAAQDRIASGARYQDAVEVWARAEYAASMRAQGREPQTDPMAISKYWTQRTMDEIRADPAAWLRLMAKKSWLMLWNAEVPNNKSFAFFQTEFFWLRAPPVRWFVLLMLAPAGIWAAAKFGNRDALFIVLAYAGLYSAGAVTFFICDRYRYPVWPAMAVLAGGGLLALIETIRQRKPRQTACILAGMTLMAALSLHNWFGVTLPNFAHDFQFRSIASYDNGNFKQALADIDRSIALDPLDSASLYQRGNVMFALNRFDDAVKAYEQTLKLIPGNAGVWNNLGTTLDALGRTDEALQAFQHATECNLPSENAFLGMAFIQIRLGRLDDATVVLNQLDKLNGAAEAASLAARSVIERRRGNSQQADALEHSANVMDATAAKWAIDQAAKAAASKH
jgi:4-amino-4-deoxy-L-arabinose transferase-like glycosyltransferase